MKKIFLTLLFAAICQQVVLAADAADASAVTKIKNLEKKLDDIEKAQKETIATQDAIITDIKNLKIIVNKR